MTYDPKPEDTSKVQLPAELEELTERLAEKIHDIWAQQRVAEGWRHGSERNDLRKEHPNLIPYPQLPESEKEYDRKAAQETIKMLLTLGCTIRLPEHKQTVAPDTLSRSDEQLAHIKNRLDTPGGPKLAEWVNLWNARDPDVWSESVEMFRQTAEQMLEMGEPLLAYDIADEGLKYFPGDVRLRRLLALALARSGASDTANMITGKLYQEGNQDEETFGLLGRTHKDLADAVVDHARKEHHFRSAYDFYAKAYKQKGGYWTGINAATTAMLLGDHDTAATLAREVSELCRRELRRLEMEKGDRYWALATLGEATLILGHSAEAADWYFRAVEVAGKRFGDLHTSRRNARLLMAHLDCDRDRIENCFRIPAAVVFAGHMIDQPGRLVPRFPPQLEPLVKDSMRERLKQVNAGFGFASIACGSDTLFLETLLELGGEVHVVLPYDKSQFIKDSVETTPGADWRARCEAILKRAAGVTLASGQRLSGEAMQLEYSNLLLQGVATLRAEQLDTSLVGLAVWDGKPGDGPGGTASTIRRWQNNALKIEIIRLDEILRINCPEILTSAPERAHPVQAPDLSPIGLAPSIRGLLFADAVGFSKLSENEVSLFVTHFFGLVGDLIKKSPHAPVVKNTWGDGLFFVFESVRNAGTFALELCETIEHTNWQERGLQDLNLRIGLHAGPVHTCQDPITGQRSYIGAHVSRAARIEPITPPGHVYASQAFAALAAADRVREFTCEYVGRVAMAKNYGAFPIYLVRRRFGTARRSLSETAGVESPHV